MGSAFASGPIIAQIKSHASDSDGKQKKDQLCREQEKVDFDVVQTANIALAIKHKQHITNLELTLALDGLHAKMFEKQKMAVVIFKYVEGVAVELGRTEKIHSESNPKFLTSFILPSSSERQDQIEFRVYDFKNTESENLEDQTLIGCVSRKLELLNDNQNSQLPLSQQDTNVKEKAILKVSCCEYDSGNLKYDIRLGASKFLGKKEICYVIQVIRDSEWIPIAKSDFVQNESKKSAFFEPQKISANKFGNEQIARFRIRFYSNDFHEELGSTDELTLPPIITQAKELDFEKAKYERVYNNGFVAGHVSILKWSRDHQDSFLTYVAAGARLHLILGIDFTSSNSKGEPLHCGDTQNLYVSAIRQIVGMLQYFDYYNQIALYGFGAKLEPYFKTMSHCFALNNNYYHPLVTGGVEEIIRYYKQTLQKVLPHGPTRYSDLIGMALDFAKAEYQASTNYYVLIILSDGGYSDYQKVVEKIVESTEYPLSIVLVGIGDGDFTEMERLVAHPLISSKDSSKRTDRNLVSFINFREYYNEEVNAMTQVKLARKTFSKIPSQFVEYMCKKHKKPNKEKKSLKAAKSEFITEKIKQGKIQPVIPDVEFLKDQKKKMRKELITLGFPSDQFLENALVMPVNDINYFLELYASKKPPRNLAYESNIEIVASNQEKKFEEHLEKNEEFLSRRIQNELLKREMNQAGRRRKVLDKAPQIIKKEKPRLAHPCLKCAQNEICMLFMDCGHLALCEVCCDHVCIVCKEYNEYAININEAEKQQSEG